MPMQAQAVLVQVTPPVQAVEPLQVATAQRLPMLLRLRLWLQWPAVAAAAVTVVAAATPALRWLPTALVMVLLLRVLRALRALARARGVAFIPALPVMVRGAQVRAVQLALWLVVLLVTVRVLLVRVLLVRAAQLAVHWQEAEVPS